jgi:hypothetical protein
VRTKSTFSVMAKPGSGAGTKSAFRSSGYGNAIVADSQRLWLIRIRHFSLNGSTIRPDLDSRSSLKLGEMSRKFFWRPQECTFIVHTVICVHRGIFVLSNIHMYRITLSTSARDQQNNKIEKGNLF